MLVINYNGGKPTTDYYKFSVQGNNNADVIRFLISLSQGGLVFSENYHYYAKVQCVDDDYYDKVELSDVEFDDINNLLKLDFTLKAIQTSHKQIEVALSCEDYDEEIVWQTQIVKITIANGIQSDEEVENNYPSVLQDLQAQIDELKQQSGGGVSDVEIKRVYLTYDDKKSLRLNILGTCENDENFVNDSTHIWLNIETTPISQEMETEITNGRFVIRFDYPIKNKGGNHIEDYNIGSTRNVDSDRNYGVGCRSFARSLLGMSERKKDVLLASLLFIQTSDIETNRYGEKYIHKKITLFDFTNRICNFSDVNYFMPITNESVNDPDYDQDLFADHLEDMFVCGVPANAFTNSNFCNHLFTGSQVNKMFAGQFMFSKSSNAFNLKTNSKKLNPAFTCYFPTKLETTQIGNIETNIYSPYFIGRKSNRYYGYNHHLILVDSDGEPLNKKGGKKFYMSAKPRCAILNDDYATSEYMFVKNYSQSTQQIKLMCKYILNFSSDYEVYVPIFRTIITAK